MAGRLVVGVQGVLHGGTLFWCRLCIQLARRSLWIVVGGAPRAIRLSHVDPVRESRSTIAYTKRQRAARPEVARCLEPPLRPVAHERRRVGV